MKNFRELGIKLTPQRIAIMDYLSGNKDHPSAEDIFISVADKFPTMSFATVYNTLLELKKRGALTELTIDPDRKRYDPSTEPHNHLICTACKRVVDISVDYKLEVPAELRTNFEITGNHIEFYGICRECKKEQNSV